MAYFFQHLLTSTAASFTMIGSATSSDARTALESSDRKWSGPHSRAVRLSEQAGLDYFLKFGSSTVVASSADSMLLLGGTAEIFCVSPSMTYLACVSATGSTAVNVNVTPGVVSN